MVNGLRRQALVLQELPAVDVAPDRDDNSGLATPGRADFLVTGDRRRLLEIRKSELDANHAA
jgi:predicted nucleic acid-binding protein